MVHYQVLKLHSQFWLGNSSERNAVKKAQVWFLAFYLVILQFAGITWTFRICACFYLIILGLSVQLAFSVSASPRPFTPAQFLFGNYFYLDSNHTLREESSNRYALPPLDRVSQIKTDWSACSTNFWSRTKGVDEYSLLVEGLRLVEALRWGAWKLPVANKWESASCRGGGGNCPRVHKSHGKRSSSLSWGWAA